MGYNELWHSSLAKNTKTKLYLNTGLCTIHRLWNTAGNMLNFVSPSENRGPQGKTFRHIRLFSVNINEPLKTPSFEIYVINKKTASYYYKQILFLL